MKFRLLIFLSFISLLSMAQRYKKIHRKAIVVDTHSDAMSTSIMRGMDLENDLTGKTHSVFKRFKEGGVDIQVFSVFCNATFGKDTAFKFANIEINSMFAIAKRNPDKIDIAKTPLEMMRIVKQKKSLV